MSTFIDTEGNQKTLQPAIIFEGKHPEEKKYLVLYIGMDDDKNEIKSFEFIEGRTATYNFIKGMIDNINIYDSKVVVETVALKDALNVFEFMKHVSKFIDDPSFDIESYNYADIHDDEDGDDEMNFSNPNNFI